jgi:hypothetical protein
MKKLITSAFLFLLIITAQASTSNDQIQSQAADMARRMANQIQLNESEYIQVKKYTVEKLAAEMQIRDMYSNDTDMMIRKLAENDSTYLLKIESLLNNSQLENYLALNKSFRSEFPVIATTAE